MGIKKWADSLQPHVALPRTYDRVTSDNLSTGEKVKTMLDPQQAFLKDVSLTDKEIERNRKEDAKDALKRKKKRMAKSRTMGAKYAKGGKTCMAKGGKVKQPKVSCRGMGCATRGGRYRKDG